MFMFLDSNIFNFFLEKKINVIFFFSHKNGTKYYVGKNIKGIINISNIM